MVYDYPELWEQMHASMLSPCCNNWSDVFDFTPHKNAATGEPNYFISGDLEPELVKPLN